MSSIVQGTYTARTYADKICSTFKWRLEDYNILTSYYNAGVISPAFFITDTSQCYLSFKVLGDGYAYIHVLLPKILQFHSLMMEVFFLNECENVKIVPDSKVVNYPNYVNSETSSENEDYYVFMLSQMLRTAIPTTKGCLYNGTLTLQCKITVIKEIKVSSLETVEQSLLLNNETCDYLKESFETQSLSDVTISIEETDFRAHKLILSMHSPVFRAMFETNMTEKAKETVKINDIDSATFVVFLKYLYTGSIDEMDDNAGNLLIVADKYQVTSLFRNCERYIIDNLKISNVIEHLLIAYEHGFKNLEKDALEFAKSCGKALVDSADFNKMCEYPTLIAQIIQ